MPSPSPRLSPISIERLRLIGQQVRERRKALGISSVGAAESAGISRVTLHRVEKGEPSVTIGAYMAVFTVLRLDYDLRVDQWEAAAKQAARKGWLPARVRVAEYPILQQLAWQVHGDAELTPREALGIYERNWRHIVQSEISPAERDLVEALRLAFGEASNV